MAILLAYDPADQAKRRRRARISQTEIARRLDIAISKVSEYETGKKALPWELTSEDYERALLDAITDKRNEGGK